MAHDDPPAGLITEGTPSPVEAVQPPPDGWSSLQMSPQPEPLMDVVGQS